MPGGCNVDEPASTGQIIDAVIALPIGRSIEGECHD
jgi:hypothetical protein